MPSLDEAAQRYGQVSLDDDRLVVVHLLLYGYDMEAPSLSDAREWAEHYGLDERDNHIVLVGDPRMIGPRTYRMIPGLQVVDEDFVLTYDSAGGSARDDLWTELWPGLGHMLGGS
ncbi:MAG: hypothetical protein GY711_06680 [bacterium]|nr:hypothetical protein [bacterium]